MSTLVTATAPARPAAIENPPVYANRLSTRAPLASAAMRARLPR
jgi:hypothetical protein